jgi:hypothetical protein
MSLTLFFAKQRERERERERESVCERKRKSEIETEYHITLLVYPSATYTHCITFVVK